MNSLRRRTWALARTFEALITLFAVKAAISLLSFERWRRWLHRSPRVQENEQLDLASAERVVRAVNRVTYFLPADLTCLPRALSVQLMLARRGLSSNLELGVRRDARGKFEAHAWVEYRGRVIIGGTPDLSRYTKLPPWPARTPR